jgi:hypothetical protein
MPRSNSFCASALHDVSKWTLPSLSSPDWAKAGWASATPVSIATIEKHAFGIVRLPFSQIRFSVDFGWVRRVTAIPFPPHYADFATKSGNVL